MFERRELITAVSIAIATLLITLNLFARVTRLESVSEKALLELPSGATTWIIKAYGKCVGRIKYSFTQGEVSWIEFRGNLRLKHAHSVVPGTLTAYFFFNQLKQFFAANVKMTADAFELRIESEQINPIHIVLDILGTTEPIRYETTAQGPIMLERVAGERDILTSPHRIKRRGKLDAILPEAWPIRLVEEKSDAVVAPDLCVNDEEALDLNSLYADLKDFIPLLRLLPGQTTLGLSGDHA